MLTDMIRQLSSQKTIVNLFAELGSFEGDLSSWFAWPGSYPQGGATGITEISTTQAKFGTQSLHCLMQNQGGGIQKDFPLSTQQAVIEDKIYVGARIYKVSGSPVSPVIRVFDYQSLTNGVQTMTPSEYAAAPTGQWVYVSTVKTLANQGIRVYTNGAAYSTYELYIDGICAANLSKTGLTKAEMDAWIINKPYFERRDYIL